MQRELRRSSSCTAFVTSLHFVCIGLGTHHAARRQCCGVGQIGHSDDQGRTIGLRRPEMAVRGHRSSNGHRPLTVSQLEFHAVLTTVLAMKRMPKWTAQHSLACLCDFTTFQWLGLPHPERLLRSSFRRCHLDQQGELPKPVRTLGKCCHPGQQHQTMSRHSFTHNQSPGHLR